MIPGLTGESEMVVKEEDIVSRLGDVDVNVLSTPSLIQLLEAAAIQAIHEYLPSDQLTLGTQVKIRHLSPTPLGMKVTAHALLKEVDKSLQADASYSAAAQAASDARAALAAQQAGAAGEAIGRAEASINEGKAQLDRLGDAVNQLREMTNLQAGQIISMTIALQQAQADKQTTLNAYNTAITAQEQTGRNDTLLRIISLFIMFLFLLAVLAFGANKLRMRAIRSDDEGAAGEIEIVDQE